MSGREHHVACFLELAAAFLHEFSCLVYLVFRLDYRSLSAIHLLGSFVHGFACIAIRPENASCGRRRKPSSFTLPIGQSHPLVSVVRNHLTVETISQRHQTDGDIVERIFVNIRKCWSFDSLRAVFTWMKSLNCHIGLSFDQKK